MAGFNVRKAPDLLRRMKESKGKILTLRGGKMRRVENEMPEFMSSHPRVRYYFLAIEVLGANLNLVG